MSSIQSCNPQVLHWIFIRHLNSQSCRCIGTLASGRCSHATLETEKRHSKLPSTPSLSSLSSLPSLPSNHNNKTSFRHDKNKASLSLSYKVTSSSSSLRSSSRSIRHSRSIHSTSINKSSPSTAKGNKGLISKDTKSKLKNNTGPISLKNTSRARASAELLVKNALHLPNTNTPSMTIPTSGATSGSQTSNHNTTHFVLGGTHCDPAPAPHILSEYGEESVYTLVLLRHGESQWNHENRYTGWCDVNLTEKGRQEARDAGRLLRENGIEIDHAFTSILKRANFTTNMALNTSNQAWVPVTKSWRLNERHYGALQGYNKDTAYKELGIDQELVMAMRRSYGTRPPPMMDDHEHWHGNDRRYTKLSKEQLEKSRAESLKDTADRIMPFFNSVILPSLRAGNKCLIVSHANTLRSLIKQIDNISDEDIKGMSIPTGIPLLYRLDKNFKPVDPNVELEFRYMVEPKGYTWATSRAHGFHGVYLGDLERLQDIQRKRDATNRDWQRIILRNLALSLHQEVQDDGVGMFGSLGDGVLEIRQLWWQIHAKMNEQEFSNMLILARMKDHLENLMYKKKQRFITIGSVETVINQLHLDTEGHVVEPFVKVSEIGDREERAKQWYENMALDLEEECLIK